MKNNQKLNDLFSEIDGALIEQASTPPRRAGKALYISLIAAILALILLFASILPAFFSDKGKTSPPFSSPSVEASSEEQKDSGEAPSHSGDSFLSSFEDEPTPILPSDPLTDEPSDPPVDPPQITVPAWYAPGNLTVRSLTRRTEQSKPESIGAAAPAIMASAPVNQTLTLKESSASLAPIGGRYVNLTALSADSEHNDHGCLLYDVKSGELICYGCMAEDLLTEPLKEGERIVIDPATTPDLLSFALYRDKENEITARYIYEPQKELLRQIPLLSKQDFGYYTVSPDGRYLLTATERRDGSGYFDYYLIDVETLNVKNVESNLATTHEAQFSPDGKNLLILLADEGGSTHIGTDKVRYLMVNVDTGANAVCEGKILSYANGLLVTRYRTEYHAYDRAKVREVEIPESTFVFEIRQNKVIRIHAQSGAEEVLTALPDAWKLSNDGLYAYAYVTGNSHLTVYSIESGEKFRVEVSGDFARSVSDLQKTKDLTYFISLNEAGDELLICYSLSAKQAKPKDNTLQATKDAFAESNSIEEFILRFEELCTVTHTYKVYKGEGFTHLLLRYTVIVEDYRAGTFTAYGDTDYTHTGISDSEGLLEYERIVALSSTKEQTDLFLKNRGLKASDATVDYAAFYENGKFSLFKARNFITTPEYLDQINGFNCWFNSDMGSFCKDLTYLRLFMAELNDCQKSFTASTPFDWSDAAGVGYITLEPGHTRICGTLCTKGVYRIIAGNNDYFVPEYVFADLITLSVFSEFNRSYTLTEGNKMTTDDLRTIFKDGLSKEEFAGYAYRLISDNRWGNGDRLLFPVYEGEEQIGYAYIKIRSDGSVEHMTLFDTDYRYIGYPAIEGIPEGEWIYQGHIDFKADR